MLLDERKKRRVALPLRAVGAGITDKFTKLRNCIQPILFREQLYVAEGSFGEEFKKQLSSFPGGVRLDCLDAFELSEKFSMLSEDDEWSGDGEEKLDPWEEEELRRLRSAGRAGY